MTLRAIAAGLGALGLATLAGCAGGSPQPPSPTKFNHPQHGEVTTADARYVAARQQCERDAYKQGVDINGRRVTDPDEAIRVAAKGLVDQARPAGVPGPVPSGIEKPAYFERLLELDKRADDCMTSGGWKQDVPPKQPLSASSRRLILKLHREGRIKLTPQEVAEYEKDLWW